MLLFKKYCYRVVLETTDSLSTAKVGGAYIHTDNGVLYYNAESMEEVGKVFPKAIEIKKVGIAYMVGAKETSKALVEAAVKNMVGAKETQETDNV